MIELVGGMLTQWDIDRSVEIANALSVDEVHFANEGDSVAVKIPVTDVDGKKTAAIPNYLLQSGKSVRAYGVNGGVTVKVISFPVRKRERPDDYVYEDDQRNYIYQLISDAKDATEKANAVAEELYKAKENGEFNGEKGDKGDKGDQGEQGIQGEKGDKGDPGVLGTMKVTVDADGRFASHSSAEIMDHVAAGGAAILEFGGRLYNFSYSNGDTVYFLEQMSNFYYLMFVTSEKYFYSEIYTFATADQIGDISSALDKIREYAESLINGGGSV